MNTLRRRAAQVARRAGTPEVQAPMTLPSFLRTATVAERGRPPGRKSGQFEWILTGAELLMANHKHGMG